MVDDDGLVSSGELLGSCFAVRVRRRVRRGRERAVKRFRHRRSIRGETFLLEVEFADVVLEK